MEEYKALLGTTEEYGEVTEVHHPLLTVVGLPKARLHEVVIFENGTRGEIFALERHVLKVLMFESQPVRVGTKLVRTGEPAVIGVGPELLGCIIDPMGRVIEHPPNYVPPKSTIEIRAEVKNISSRSLIKRQFVTGMTMVDLLVPLGDGQKELVIGDRKTGKTSFFFSCIKQNARRITIYALIGKNMAEIRYITALYKKNGLHKNVVFVVASSIDSSGMIFMTPYSAMAIAEFFRDRGLDVLVIMDSLSIHAKFYREISLLAGGFPGKESYPGDMFYTHASLLERAGNFIHSSGRDVSITCLPVVETIEGELSSYIPTNVMGMTDGHLFFDSNSYYKGRRPPIDLTLSVTRVGRQTQSALQREINQELMTFITHYERLQNISYFGTELSQKVKDQLKKGETLFRLFNQQYSVILPLDLQLLLFALVWLNIFTKYADITLEEVRDVFFTSYKEPMLTKILKEVVVSENLYQLLTAVSRHESELKSIWETKKASSKTVNLSTLSS